MLRESLNHNKDIEHILRHYITKYLPNMNLIKVIKIVWMIVDSENKKGMETTVQLTNIAISPNFLGILSPKNTI